MKSKPSCDTGNAEQDMYEEAENTKTSPPRRLARQRTIVEARCIRRRPYAPLARMNKTASTSPIASMETIWRRLADGIVVVDRTQKIVMANAEARRLAQIDPQEMSIELAPLIWGRMLDLQGREIPVHQWPCAKASRGESTTQQECRLVHESGRYYDVLFSAAPITVANGEPAAAVVTMTDLTRHNSRALVLRQQAVSRERRRMAEDIHDAFCQRLHAIVLQLQTAQDYLMADCQPALRHLTVAYDVARECLTEARRSMWTFCHESLGDIDPAFTLSRVAEQIVRGTPISLNLSLQPQPRALSPKVPFELVRISQEALSNVVKHSRATKVDIELAYKRQTLHFSVQDDGRGFIRTHSNNRKCGFGLISMQERAERLGGKIIIDSKPGRGTRVAAVIPLSSHSAA